MLRKSFNKDKYYTEAEELQLVMVVFYGDIRK